MKRYLFILLVFACALPLWALEETVTISAGSTETLPTTVSDELQTLADDAGLTLLGWTTSPISDSHSPATYYGLGATVTPASNTTYYAFFARSANPGELIIRQTTSPADGDTVLLATITGSTLLLPRNSLSSDMVLTNNSSFYSATLLTMSDAATPTYSWIYIALPSSQFELQSTSNDTYYLNAISSVVRCGSQNARTMQIISGFMYSISASRYLRYELDYGDPYWRPSTSKPVGQSFAFYRKERYVDFCTSITEPQPCPNCFIFTH